ncbi:MAG: 2,3-bisphosphoglycerate-independent phosphoglycerate mutase [Bacteroidota bacterium]
MSTQKAILIILDGWGHGQIAQSSAIAQANIPYISSLYENHPNAELITHGEDVGLPEGQMGNSEVGHLNIGAGRVVYQELARINKAIRKRELHQHHALIDALAAAKKRGAAVHLMGLVSDGGVHSHINHLKALIDIAEENGPSNIYIHAFTDGRDVDPQSGKQFITDLEGYIEGKNTQLASLIGRYYAMDRDKRWERIQKAYDLLVKGTGKPSQDVVADIQASYDEGVTDEFILPIAKVDAQGQAIARLQDDDLLICFNFRTDRPRQISEVLTQKDFAEYGMQKLQLHYLTMTRYDADFDNITVLFQKEDIVDTLGQVLSEHQLTQVRIAETEKYPHVTFFFSGGREKEFEGEKRILVPSPKVATYDLQPEMSAPEITSAIVAEINANQPNFVCINYANTDMVGHTGVFPAAIKAAEIVDAEVQKLLSTALALDYHAIIIADHGNSDYMINEDGSPNTAHTKNLVPILYVSNSEDKARLRNGRLADVAPSILALLGIPQPAAMTGQNLIEFHS